MEKDIIAEGLPIEEGKFCVDCKHLIGVRHRPDTLLFWRCGHERNIKEIKVNLVTGIKYKVFEGNALMDIRELTCKGDWWEEYITPTHETRLTSDFTETFSDEQLRTNAEAAAKKVAEARMRKSSGLKDIKATDL